MASRETTVLSSPRQLTDDSYLRLSNAMKTYDRCERMDVGVNEAREEFHLAVLDLFQEIRSKLVNEDSVEEYWLERPVFQEQERVYKTDEDGNVLFDEGTGQPIVEYQHMRGLQALDQYVGKYDRVERDIDDVFGKRTVIDERPVTLCPESLRAATLALKEVIDKLGIGLQTHESLDRDAI